MLSHPLESSPLFATVLTMRQTPSSLVLLAAIALAGCPTTPSGDDAGTDAFTATDAFAEAKPSCEQIIARCHDVDPGSGPIHDCHEAAHDEATSEATCASMLDTCAMLCSAVDAGVIHDEDAPGHMH